MHIELQVLNDVEKKHNEILRGIARIKEELQGVNVYLKAQNFLKK